MPAKFTFRLQPVLDQRERIEEQRQLALVEIQRDRLRCEETLRQIQADAVTAREGLRGQLQGQVTQDNGPALAGVRLQANAALHLNLRAQRAAIELAGVLKRFEAARLELVKASADRKAVQLLKDKRLAEHRAVLARRELAAGDELAVMRHGRGAPQLSLNTGDDRP